jgi:hypothetical protein
VKKLLWLSGVLAFFGAATLLALTHFAWILAIQGTYEIGDWGDPAKQHYPPDHYKCIVPVREPKLLAWIDSQGLLGSDELNASGGYDGAPNKSWNSVIHFAGAPWKLSAEFADPYGHPARGYVALGLRGVQIVWGTGACWVR